MAVSPVFLILTHMLTKSSHLQREYMDFAEFSVRIRAFHIHKLLTSHSQKAAVSSPGLSSAMQHICVNLLAQVRQEQLVCLPHGAHITPGSVKRGGSQGESHFALFLSFPYYSVAPKNESAESSWKQPARDTDHRTRSLLQKKYLYESIAARNESQAISKHFEGYNDQIIYVPQIWALVVGSGLYVTFTSG